MNLVTPSDFSPVSPKLNEMIFSIGDGTLSSSASGPPAELMTDLYFCAIIRLGLFARPMPLLRNARQRGIAVPLLARPAPRYRSSSSSSYGKWNLSLCYVAMQTVVLSQILLSSSSTLISEAQETWYLQASAFSCWRLLASLSAHATNLSHCYNRWQLQLDDSVDCPGARFAATYGQDASLSFVLPTTYEDSTPIPKATSIMSDYDHVVLAVSDWYPIDLSTACGSGRRAGYKINFWITVPDATDDDNSTQGCCIALATGVIEISAAGENPAARLDGPVKVYQDCDLGVSGCSADPELSSTCSGSLWAEASLAQPGRRRR
ncbi:uncharacterized protein L969DRAFT_95013 [Mixia osmundae IAM 14324]|uniref:Uncharacterized protein n=1 Tax=Mixia osmundae (strain CBS 9802 / IAM 14324 / JCM 22182 / KY 12970) TaxID=764103 RepID=G7E112_MIXOS|nr:uncharacterized protein L969DRAFT_95013 [Mixia osmundae IAM 14324]KEI38843.1 hypothetical protein L969DRAFT_95013 [Mixia osmundae IAM 14324]GAA96522.1 hypothetical protein E5Q_03190 [Mixia osmundae IAM 14324]